MAQMKSRAHGANSAAIQSGFTLLEVMVTLVITMVLMTAMAGIFQQSISTRAQVEREGQRLESSRFSLDTLTEDIRLAGYYGPLTIPSGSIDWVYADPCTEGAGWSAPDPSISTTRTVPFPIYGYEAHKANITSPPGCITVANKSVYRAGTDMLVIRRVSTTPGLSGTGFHLQHSACADTSKDRVPFIASNDATTFTLLGTDVLQTPPKVCAVAAPIYRLITRIYFISACDDCSGGGTGDGIPTLKVVEVGAGDPRTVATGVEDMHMEYGVDQTTSAIGGDGAVDGYVVSNNNPRTTGADGTAVGGTMLPTSTAMADATLRPDSASGEDRWEDVMTVKVSLVVRDTSEYQGVAGTRSFTLGISDNAPTVLTSTYPKTGTDKFRRKLSVTTVSAVNLGARREQ